MDDIKNSSESAWSILIRLVCCELDKRADEGSFSLNTDEISLIFNQKIREHGLVVWRCSKYNNYTQVIECLADEFLTVPKEIKENFSAEVCRASEKREKLFAALDGDRVLPDSSEIQEYLSAYYSLLAFLYLHFEDFMGQDEAFRFIFDSLLNIDMDFQSDHPRVSIYNPIVLDGVNHLYSVMMDYFNKSSAEKNRLMRHNCQEIIVSKLLRLFRWHIVHDGTLMQAALPAYRKECDGCLDIPIRDLKAYSSYEGIGELRLLDKVLYELDQISQDDTISEVRIALFGDINEKPMSILAAVLADIIENKKKNEDKYSAIKNLSFSVYTKNAVEKKKNILMSGVSETSIGCQIGYDFFDYKELYEDKIGFSSRKLVGNLAQSKYDVVFLLDICGLYSSYTVVPARDWQRIRLKLSNSAYETYFYETSRGRLEQGGTLYAVLEQLYAGMYQSRLGYFKKDINSGLIDYLLEIYEDCEKEDEELQRKTKTLSEIESPGTIYVFASDRYAFEKKYFDNNSFLRIEHYNEKDVAVMRMSKRREDPLKLKKQGVPNVIVFNMWQFAKHTSLRNIKDIMSEVLFTDQQENIYHLIYLLKNIHIGVDYSDWPKAVYLYYQYDAELEKGNPAFEKRLVDNIEGSIVPFLGKCNADMFNEYFIKVCGSFLYSAVKDVEDMLFVHLFKDKHDKLGKAVCVGKTDKLLNYRPKSCKYAQKRYYESVMSDYDTSSENFEGKYEKLGMLDRLKIKNKIFSNVRDASRNINYQDSNLCENCIKIVGP